MRVIMHILIVSAISCSVLSSILNGVIEYSMDVTDPFDYGTTATYTCNDGFFLESNSERICGGDGSTVTGSWEGMTPVCTGMYPDGLKHFCVINFFPSHYMYKFECSDQWHHRIFLWYLCSIRLPNHGNVQLQHWIWTVWKRECKDMPWLFNYGQWRMEWNCSNL